MKRKSFNIGDEPFKKLIAKILLQAIEDYNAEPSRNKKLEKAIEARSNKISAAKFLRSEQCKLYCDALDINHDWLLKQVVENKEIKSKTVKRGPGRPPGYKFKNRGEKILVI